MESDFQFDIIIQDGGHAFISRRKVLPPGECSRSVCSAQRPSVPDL